MDVEQTKRLILRRLSELRAQQAGPPPPPPPFPPNARPVKRRRRQRDNGFFANLRRPAASDLALRLQRLEDRLNAVERFFFAGASPEMRAAAQQKLARVQTLAGGRKEAPDKTLGSTEGASEGAAEAQSLSGSAPTTEQDTYKLNGSVEDGLMTDVLQMIASNRKSGRFSLLLDSRDSRFDLFFQDGEIVHAKAGELAGENAFFALMSAGHQEGRYGFVEGVNDVPKTIEAQTHFMILEALRRIDEGEAGEAKGPE